MEIRLRRQALSGRDRLWRSELRLHITNSIAKAVATGRFYNIPGEGADEIAVALSDCNAIDPTRYKSYCWGVGEIESTGKDPQAMEFFISSANRHIRPFSLIFGPSNRHDRRKAPNQLIWFRNPKPELINVAFLVGHRDRLCYEYTESARRWVRETIRILHEGANRDFFATLQRIPFEHNSKQLRRWPNVFSFSAPNGVWGWRIFPEISEKLEFRRINGSGQLRAFNQVADVPRLPSDGKKNRCKRADAKLADLSPRRWKRSRKHLISRQVIFLTHRVGAWGRRNSKPRRNTDHGMPQPVSHFVGTSMRTLDAPHLGGEWEHGIRKQMKQEGLHLGRTCTVRTQGRF